MRSRARSWGPAMTDTPENVWDQRDHRDQFDIVSIFRSRLSDGQRDHRDHYPATGPAGPVPVPATGTTETQQNKPGPGGPGGPGEKPGRCYGLEPDAPDPDGVARTPEAIERVWSEAIRRAVEYRKTQKPPTCAQCGKADWTVSVTEITGRKLHASCWKEERQ